MITKGGAHVKVHLDVTPGGCKFCVRVCAAIFIHRAWSYGQNTGVVPRPTLARIQIFDANFPGTLLVLNQIIGLALVGDVAPTVSCFCRITTISLRADTMPNVNYLKTWAVPKNLNFALLFASFKYFLS